jgi:hypothetical protein
VMPLREQSLLLMAHKAPIDAPLFHLTTVFAWLLHELLTRTMSCHATPPSV